MSKEITDAMLDGRTTELIRQQFPEERLTWKAAHSCTRAALEVEREALVVIEGLMSTLRTIDKDYEAPIVTDTLDRLRTRLGITE